ncbi:MAG: hypothetical protein PHD60_07180 [Clostridia bacterium]|nr:hypothetical protein [Clostridia bacterium]
MAISINININAPELEADIRAIAAALSATLLTVSGVAETKQNNQIKTCDVGAKQVLPVQQVPTTLTVPTPTPAAPTQAIPQNPVTPTIPTTAQTYSIEQLAVAATQLVDSGRRTELVGLLTAFGVQALTALPKEQYGAFVTQLRALGAKI